MKEKIDTAAALKELGAAYDKAFQAEHDAKTNGRLEFCAGMTTAYRDALEIVGRIGEETK